MKIVVGGQIDKQKVYVLCRNSDTTSRVKSSTGR